MKNLRRLIFLVSIVASLILFSGVLAPRAFAASHSNLAAGTHNGAISPHTSGGGCNTWTDWPPQLTDKVCVSENSSRTIVPDAYVSTTSPGDYTYFIIRVDLLDATTGVWKTGPTNNLSYPYGHYYGPQIPAVAGHHYIAYTSWYLRINVSGTKVISEHQEYSPVQIA